MATGDRWQFLWLKIIAEAWRDDDFKRQLTDTSKDAREVVKNKFSKEHIHIPFPLWVNFIVKEPEDATWVPAIRF